MEYWVEGVLKRSLHHEVLISLGKRSINKAVDAPWKYTVEVPDPANAGRLDDRDVCAIFDATGLLLILGEPGSGKTTTLLDLARRLLKPSTNPTVQDFRYTANTNVSVPNGYYASCWNASLMYMTGGSKAFPDCQIAVSVGAGTPVTSPTATAVVGPYTNITDQITDGKVGPISQGSVPVAVQVINNTGFQISVEIDCQPLNQTLQQWESDTYGIIAGAYNSMLQAYNDELSGLNIQQTNLVDANSPDQNALTITQELKRQVIEMLGVTTASAIPPPPPPNFFGPNAINWDTSANPHAPYTLLDKAAA
jgi:DNA polymerase III delta prime subunit